MAAIGQNPDGVAGLLRQTHGRQPPVIVATTSIYSNSSSAVGARLTTVRIAAVSIEAARHCCA